jgi:hypothetical protein
LRVRLLVKSNQANVTAKMMNGNETKAIAIAVSFDMMMFSGCVLQNVMSVRSYLDLHQVLQGERMVEASSLQRFEKRDDVADLAGVEPEFRHCRMTGDDSFRQCFLQCFDRIPQMKVAKRRSDTQRT